MFKLNTKYERWLFQFVILEDTQIKLFSTFYPDVIFDFKEVQVFLNGRPCRYVGEHGRNEYEPIRVVTYDFGPSVITSIITQMNKSLVNNSKFLTTDKYIGKSIFDVDTSNIDIYNSLIVKYKDQSKAFVIKKHDPLKNKNILFTMFKHDYMHIEKFVQHYISHGVDNFVLCYNGKLSDVIDKLYKHPSIEYIESNVSFWTDGYVFVNGEAYFSDTVVDTNAKKNWHHAQILFMNMIFHRHQEAKSLINLDLDEIIYSKKRLVDSIGDNGYLYFYYRWAQSDTYPFKEVNQITVRDEFNTSSPKYMICPPKLKKDIIFRNHYFISNSDWRLYYPYGKSTELNDEIFIMHMVNGKRESVMTGPTKTYNLYIK